MTISFIDKWLIAEGPDSGRRFVVHTQYPRFVLELCELEAGGYESGEFEYVDECLDPSLLARLARQAGEVLARYDQESG